jgi:hypothetical protein
LGSVARSVEALLADLDLEPGSYAAMVAALAVAQGRMVDAGNANAAASLRQTLADLDDQLGLTPPEAEGWFSLLDIRLAIKREGVDPASAVGQALLAAGHKELITWHPPPPYPPGWRGTAVHGDPCEYAKRTDVEDWADVQPAPLRFWPEWRLQGHRYKPD